MYLDKHIAAVSSQIKATRPIRASVGVHAQHLRLYPCAGARASAGRQARVVGRWRTCNRWHGHNVPALSAVPDLPSPYLGVSFPFFLSGTKTVLVRISKVQRLCGFIFVFSLSASVNHVRGVKTRRCFSGQLHQNTKGKRPKKTNKQKSYT